MSTATTVDGEVIKHQGWTVTFAAMGINLALGILYTWSVISKRIPEEWGWNQTDKSLPFMVACLVFSIAMVPAGRLQDRIGPRWVATLGGLLVGLGMILASLTQSSLGVTLAFGVLAGVGIGFGYASATPPAVKWFSPARTGLIAGIVVSGFGLASVYTAPLSMWLIAAVGVQQTFLILGIAFLVIVCGLAQILTPPRRALQFIERGGDLGVQKVVAKSETKTKVDFRPTEMLRTWQFFLLWFMYACGAGAGLMVIAKLDDIAKKQAAIELGFILVAVMAIGNGGGRILTGIVSDKIGRKATLMICFILQTILVLLLWQARQGSFLASPVILGVISALIGANYGANLALFPSITKDFYGLKNFGVNYGLVFTAWGVGGFMLAWVAGQMYDRYQSFDIAYFGAAGLLVLAAIVTLFIKPPHRQEAQAA